MAERIKYFRLIKKKNKNDIIFIDNINVFGHQIKIKRKGERKRENFYYFYLVIIVECKLLL